jgi:hypothetical protein
MDSYRTLWSDWSEAYALSKRQRRLRERDFHGWVGEYIRLRSLDRDVVGAAASVAVARNSQDARHERPSNGLIPVTVAAHQI